MFTNHKAIQNLFSEIKRMGFHKVGMVLTISTNKDINRTEHHRIVDTATKIMRAIEALGGKRYIVKDNRSFIDIVCQD